MGAIEDLAAALVGQQAQGAIKAENPYYGFGDIGDQLGGVITKAAGSGRYSTKDILIPALLSGLTSGIFKGAGDQYQSTLTDRYQKAALGLSNGQDVTAESSQLPPSLFRNVDSGVKVFKLQQGLADAQAEKDAQRAVDKQVLLNTNPQIFKAKILEQAVSSGALDPEEAVAALGKAPTDVLQTKTDPTGAYPAGTRRAAAHDKAIEDSTDSLRKEFNALPEVKTYSQVAKTAGIITEAIKDPSSVSDQELVRYSVLLMEPGMAVREGEQAAMAASTSIPDKWKGYLNKSLTGGTALPPDVREGMKKLAMRAYDGHKAQYDTAFNFYQDQANKKGLDPKRISYLGESPSSESIFNKKSGVTIPPGAQPTGRTVKGQPTYIINGVEGVLD